MLSVTQIRNIQGLLAPLLAADARERVGLNDTLQLASQLPDPEIVDCRLVDLRAKPSVETAAVYFRRQSDPAHSAHLIPADNREPPTAMHIALGENERYPTLVGLHYVHMTRRKAGVARYLLVGALATYEDPDFEYSRLKRLSEPIEQLAAFLYNLNTPVADLPYPTGRKLSILAAFKKMEIRYVGELARRSEDDLKALLSEMEWITVRSILLGLKLPQGLPIPHWKPPRSSETP
ncbi:MAG TPA: hypothetical protein VLJ37_06525 [bacterium]|nr:hypothetical protein [bacterium]